MLLTVIQDSSAQSPRSVLTVKSVMKPESPDSVLTNRLDTAIFWKVVLSSVKPSMVLTVSVLIDAESMVKVLKNPALPCMLLMVIQESSAQSPRSVLIVKSAMKPDSPDSVLTNRLDTAIFWKVVLSSVKPSMVLTVSVLIDAVLIAKVLNDPALPCMLLTVIQDSSAQSPRSVLTVKSVTEPVTVDSVLTNRLDTAIFWKVVLSSVKPSMVLTVSVLIDAVLIAKVLNDPALPCILLTVIQDSSAQSPRSVLTVKSVMKPDSPDSVLTNRLDTAIFWKVVLSSVKPSMVLTVSVLIDAVLIAKVLNDPALP